MSDNAMKRLCEAIIQQAVNDYQELKRRNIGWIGSVEDGQFSLTEIEHFFRSNWCKALLRGIGSRIDGVTILRHLKSENA